MLSSRKYATLLLFMFSCVLAKGESQVHISGVSNDSLIYCDAAAFPVLGKIYTDSLPRYSRMPYFLKPCVRKALWNLGQNSSGIAIRFRTNSTVISSKWEVAYNNSMSHMSPTGVKGLDLYCWHEGEWRFVKSAQPTGKSNSAVIISGMKPVEREYMLYLPLYDGISLLEIGVDTNAYIKLPRLAIPSEEKPVVFYGSSIMQGACASRPGMSASAIISRRLNRETINLGFSANAFIDYEIAEMMADIDAAAFVLDFVPNASVEQIKSRTGKFLEILRAKHPVTPVIFVEDPVFTHSLFDGRIAKEVADKNSMLDMVFKDLKKSGWKDIYLVRSGKMIGEDGEATVDGIHFTDLGFVRYTALMLPVLQEVINKNSDK